MGVGSSKFGKKGNNRNMQYMYPPPMFTGPYGPQPSYNAGYAGYPMFVPPAPQFNAPPQQPMQPFVPPGAQYGQGQYLPQPLLSYLPQDRQPKRRSRRTYSDRYPDDGGQTGDTSRRTYSESHSRPSAGTGEGFIARPIPVDPTGHAPPHRTPTPFIPAYGHEDSETDEEVDRPRSATVTSRRESSRTPVRYPTPPPIVAELGNVIEPLEPASRGVFGPEGQRPRGPLKNPLPPPPRDLYEMTPYRSLLSLPHTTALLTATYGQQHATLTNAAPQPENDDSIKRRKSGKGGLLRAFSRKEKPKPPPEKPQVHFIPVFVPGNKDGPTNPSSSQTHIQQPQPPLTPTHQAPPPTQQAFIPPPVIPISPSSEGTPEHDQPMPVPPIPSSPPAIRFDQQGRYAVFMNHSPHRVIWRGKEYPTALHLHEALKFMETRPDLAERIRACEQPEDVYPLSAQFQQYQRPDWGQVFMDMMREVLYQKFRQHPDLRTMLLSTGAARLIYLDPDDGYWGSGPDSGGQNELGQVLVDVRNRLINEAPTAHP